MGDQSTFDFFRQETSHADTVIRNEAMANLALVCAVTTPEKVRSDIIPYLQTKLNDADQVVLAMAKKLGELVPFIGGAEYAHLLVPHLESLCSSEETVVRTAAGLSANKILTQVDPSQHSSSAQAYFGLLKRLSGGEEATDTFYSKVACCLMIDEVYRVMVNPDDRTAVQEIYMALCRDEMAIVRRAAAQAFPKIVKVATPEVQATDFLELLKSMSSLDEHQTVRILAVQAYVPFCLLLQQNNTIQGATEDLITLIKAAVDDNSWRVRLAIVKDFGKFATCFPAEMVSGEVFTSYVHLLQDSESDVRSCACESALPFIDIVGADVFLAEVVPISQQLSTDITPGVRKSLADMCVDVAAKVGPEAVAQHMSDLVMKCLEDEDPGVKLRVLLKIKVLATDVPTLLTRLTPTLKALYKDESWRVRKQIVTSMPAVMKSMGNDFFVENFLDDYLGSFKDSVAEVRVSAGASLSDLCEASSASWVYDRVFPTIKGMANEEYAYRVAMLGALKCLLGADLSDRFQGEIVGLLLTSAADVVANVRLATAIILGEAVKRITGDNSAAVIAQIKPVLSELEGDKDKDVKYFAAEAIKVCS